MRKSDAERAVQIDPSLDRRIEAHAADALRELWDKTVDDATADPRSRLVTPAMVKGAIEARLRDVLGAGALLPRVDVRLNAERTGFEVDIKPGELPGSTKTKAEYDAWARQRFGAGP